MSSFNKTILVGRLTRDVELRHIPSGTAVAEIGLAVSRNWFDKASNSKKEETSFFDVVMWARTAEVASEYLSKGSLILVEGYLRQESWIDKETGSNRSKVKVVCENMTMLGSKSEPSRTPQDDAGEGPQTDGLFAAPDTDDVPF